MKRLNLTDLEKSDIKYKKIPFPDGQQNIVIQNSYIKNDGYGEEWFHKGLPKIIQIKSRLNNWLDLEFIVCAVASLRELGVEEIHLYTPYIMGARSDRKFEEGGNNYLRDVLAPAINVLNFKTVTCIDPHSDVLEACIKGFRKQSNLELVKFTIRDLCGFTHGRNPKLDDFILVSPAAGASKKIYKLAEEIGYKGDIIVCSKDRDENGKLNRTVVPELSGSMRRDVIIIDDICDGGRTFINIAKELKKQELDGKIYLIVTHGIFSKGFAELSKYFDGIYCTNSYCDALKTFGPYKDLNGYSKEFIKQLNVF